MIKDIPADILLRHHRLTPEKVNQLLGVEHTEELIEEKMGRLAMVGEFIGICDAFRSASIAFVPLKGPVLAHRLYGDVTARSFGDIDILVEEASVCRAAGVLIEMGYLPPSTHWIDNTSQERILKRHTNELAFVSQGTNSVVELHWRLLKVPVTGDVLLRKIIDEGLQQHNLPRCSFTILSNEMELLFLVIHGGWHWWHRLKWLVDIRDYLDTIRIDNDEFVKMVELFRAERMVGLCNAMLQEHFPESSLLPATGAGNRFMVRFCRKRIASHSEPLDDFYGRAFGSVWYSLVSFPGLKYKLKTLRNYLFVPELYGQNRMLSWLPLFYVYGVAKVLLSRAGR